MSDPILEILDRINFLHLPLRYILVILLLLIFYIVPNALEKINFLSASFRLPENPNSLERWWSGFLFVSFGALRGLTKIILLLWIPAGGLLTLIAALSILLGMLSAAVAVRLFTSVVSIVVLLPLPVGLAATS
ncbi:MAG: hypothetical protein JW929_12465 [Anaerolineales bacterium]|nr:hypothetical protein [Anaerolineales bacterium]